MKFGGYDVGGQVVKQDDRYIVKDNTALERLVVSSTTLKPGKETNGHKHDDQEEVYHFVHGKGRMQLDDQTFDVYSGDIVLVKGGVFHKVFNTDQTDMYFVCVFEGKRSH
jgi:mannose-6-phosphate isomerase-like protein (cupin superfamily)